MRTTVATLAVVSMLVLLAFFPAVHVEFPIVHVRAQGPPPAEKVNITDYGEDNNGDLLYEFLVVNFTLYVAKSGSYRVYGYLIHGNTSYSINSTTKTLGVGLQYLELRFNSIPIYNNSLNGQFRVNYSLRYNNAIFHEDDYITRSYNSREFFALDNFPYTQPKYTPTITKDSQNERYVLNNSVMSVWFYYKIPRLVWFYTKDNKTMDKWYCEFLAIHGYVERGSGFDPSAAQYKGNLKAHGGITTSSESGRSRIYGWYVSVTVTLTDVPINATSSGNPEKLADITFTVMLAAGDRSMGLGLNRFYTISGGTQLSVNVNIDLGSSLGINGLAIEQDMWSASVKKYPHDLRLTDQSNTQIEWESTDARLIKFLPGGSEPQQVKFQPKNTVQPNVYDAYYYWISRAKVDGTPTSDIMFYQYMPTEKRLKMFLAVETGSTSITNVQTDPLGIGLFEDGFPPVPTKKINPTEQPSFLITIMGWVTAVILVILPLYVDFKRAQKRIRELEEEFGEDL
jgi:hypothetical protein